MTYHRFENSPVFNYKLKHLEFEVIKETECGVWIRAVLFSDVRRFVLDDARKRYAYPTKKLALESFVCRKKSQIKILKFQLSCSEQALFDARAMTGDDHVT